MNHQDIASDLAKAAPTIAVAATGVMGVNWSTVTYMLTALYTLLLIGQFCYRVFKMWSAKRRANLELLAKAKRRRVVTRVIAKQAEQDDG